MVLLDTETPGTSREIYSEDAVSLMYLDVWPMWNRSEIFRKSKINQGVKPDYHVRVSNSSKFADIVNFYRIL